MCTPMPPSPAGSLPSINPVREGHRRVEAERVSSPVGPHRGPGHQCLPGSPPRPSRDSTYEVRFRWCRPTNPTMTRSFGSSQAKAIRIVWCGSRLVPFPRWAARSQAVPST